MSQQVEAIEKVIESFHLQSVKPINLQTIRDWFKNHPSVDYVDVYGFRFKGGLITRLLSVKEAGLYKLKKGTYPRVFKYGKQGGVLAASVPLDSLDLVLFF